MGAPDIRQALRTRIAQVDSSPTVRCSGVVTQVVGAIVESEGPAVALGDLCEVETGDGDLIRVQVVGFRENRVLSMPLDEPGPLQPGRRIVARRTHRHAPAGPEVLGRVLDGFGRPADGAGPLHTSIFRDLYLSAPGPLERKAISEPLATGVRVIDGLLPCGKGQRVGIFGGSGVGKTTLLGAMARASEADVNVIALIGERNREVRAFLDETLGAEGLAKSVVIAATSDRPAPVRVRATFLATAIAEAFRDRGKNVLLIMDSVTRLAMAQREIGLAAGEPPSGKGYTPSVFQMLPKIFERAGNFASGSITGFYTVLVEGDDMNDPIADAARAVLDGHIVLSRELAAANHYPAVDALESVSRLAQSVAAQEHLDWASRLRDSMATYRRSEDLINLGAYAGGSNPAVDSALAAHDDVVSFLKQDLSAHQSLDETLGQLQALAQKIVKPSSLERLATFRRQQLEAAEAKLAQLRARRDNFENEIRLAAADSINVRNQAIGRTQADGGSLTALQDYLDLLELRQVQSAHSAAGLEPEIDQQLNVALTARREAEIARRLLEKRRRAERLRATRTQQAQLDDWFLTRLVRRGRKGSQQTKLEAKGRGRRAHARLATTASLADNPTS